MTTSSEFRQTIKRGVRTAHADLVIHMHCGDDGCAEPGVETEGGPRIGLIVGKAVGGSVVRHRVSRRLRHAAAELMPALTPADRVVIRALPSSAHALSAGLRQQLREGIARGHRRRGCDR